MANKTSLDRAARSLRKATAVEVDDDGELKANERRCTVCGGRFKQPAEPGSAMTYEMPKLLGETEYACSPFCYHKWQKAHSTGAGS